jgi:protein gp37
MAQKSKIEWTDATWNPIRGCSRVSEGCRHCYAETVAKRFSGAGLPYEGLTTLGKWNGTISFVVEHMLDPLRWKQPRRIFVNSMSDLFHENVTDEILDQIFAVMALCPQHTFQILTKRAERMLAYLRMVEEEKDMERWRQYADIYAGAMRCTDWPEPEWPLPNQKAADERIPLLLQTPAAVRFVSAEPLLGPVQLDDIVIQEKLCEWHFSALGDDGNVEDDADFHGAHLDWVICGGESGPGARPMHPDRARSLRDQCVAAGVPFFFKQWGEWAPFSMAKVHEFLEAHPGLSMKTSTTLIKRDGTQVRPYCMKDAPGHEMVRVGKRAAGDLLDGVQWHQFPVVQP